MNDKGHIVLAAGGTGGHLYPAEALAEELTLRGYEVTILTDKRGNAFKRLGDTVKVKTICSATFKSGMAAKLQALFNIGLGGLQSLFLFLTHRPKLVVGFGGYPSFPPVLAAQCLFIKTILHEQNAILGKANEVLAARADRIAASLPNTRGIKDASKVVVTGNPVRAPICAVRAHPYPSHESGLNIFITGGSQAAKVFGDVVPEAVSGLNDNIKQGLKVVHQCKQEDIEETEARYKEAGVEAEVKSFFDDMPDRLSDCHLFIGRSGASTVAEIAVVGRPAIFVPYPYNADRQQYYNAEIIAEKGGAWVFDEKEFTIEKARERIDYLANHRDILQNAASVTKECGAPDAVKRLADLVEERIN